MKLSARLWLPLPPTEVFPFFGEAANLQQITPGWLDFTILSASPLPLRQGTLIDYWLRLHGVPMAWQSEITVWRPPYQFRDEQRRGPYRHWSHTHTFSAHAGGTLCLDDVDYRVPGGPLVERLFVRHKLRRIFEFRQQALLSHFTRSGQSAHTASPEPAWQVSFTGSSGQTQRGIN